MKFQRLEIGNAPGPDALNEQVKEELSKVDISGKDVIVVYRTNGAEHGNGEPGLDCRVYIGATNDDVAEDILKA